MKEEQEKEEEEDAKKRAEAEKEEGERRKRWDKGKEGDRNRERKGRQVLTGDPGSSAQSAGQRYFPSLFLPFSFFLFLSPSYSSLCQAALSQ